MKPHKARIAVTTKYDVEIHGEDEHTVQEQAEKMDSVQITNAGDIVAGDESIEVLDIELLYPEDHEDEEPVEEVEVPEQPNIFEEIDDDHVGRKASKPEQEFVDLDSLKASDPAEGEEKPNGE